MTAELIKAAPEMTFLRGELANITDFEVVALERSGRMDEAAALARLKTQALAGALAADPKHPMLLNQAYLDDIRIGDLAKAAGRLDAAVAAYRRGLQKIARATELEPDNVTWRDNLQTCHTRIGDALYDSKRWAEAEGAYRRAATAAETAFATASHRADPANRVFLARIKIGDALSAANKPESALNICTTKDQWILLYFAIGLDCAVVILESLFNAIQGLGLTDLTTPREIRKLLQWEINFRICELLGSETEFHRRCSTWIRDEKQLELNTFSHGIGPYVVTVRSGILWFSFHIGKVLYFSNQDLSPNRQKCHPLLFEWLLDQNIEKIVNFYLQCVMIWTNSIKPVI